ncbi:hypothetical protein [Paenibacillus sp. LK1]|uniref:hypothetical protein n=1 Tax=Paenibacillus sp. LK1 TaxID=2053014 RepID=UPI0015D48245|nr:hypothetical protein [Paenibacillus sp. LK1]
MFYYWYLLGGIYTLVSSIVALKNREYSKAGSFALTAGILIILVLTTPTFLDGL